MTLAEFRELTQDLDGDLVFCCAGADIGLLWHSDDSVGIDDDCTFGLDDGSLGDANVLFRDEHEFAAC